MVILYRPKAEHSTEVETYLRDYKAKRGETKAELMDVDSREGSALAEVYDIVQYPAVLAINNDGNLAQAWQGEMLPLMDDVAFYDSIQG